MTIANRYHYPPELFQLLIQAIPRLFRSKKSVLLFFRGAGVSPSAYQDLWSQVELNPQSISKFGITQIILSRLNDRTDDTALQHRREILKQITDFEDFSTCWSEDQLQAKGLVAEIRRVVNVKDSFTKMYSEREKERQQRIAEQEQVAAKKQAHKTVIEDIKRDLYPWFGLTGDENREQRGRILESILNRLFKLYGISVRESFTIVKEEGMGIAEQIDGVIDLTGNTYFVEMKWIKEPINVNHVSRHLIRIYHRGYSRGIFISATPFTPGALQICKEALQRTVVFLCTLEELVKILDEDQDLVAFLKEKENAAIADVNPFKKY